ncbi:hypothetical protein A2U01_0047218, partial [Trifolium medium]|nr:hypothetical protein [Trifolium medium]
MSMESVTFFYGGDTLSPTEPESELKRPKSEVELGSDYDRISEEFHDNLKLSNFSVYDDDDEPMYGCDEFVYKNKAWKKLEDEDDHYIDPFRNLSVSI